MYQFSFINPLPLSTFFQVKYIRVYSVPFLAIHSWFTPSVSLLICSRCRDLSEYFWNCIDSFISVDVLSKISSRMQLAFRFDFCYLRFRGQLLLLLLRHQKKIQSNIENTSYSIYKTIVWKVLGSLSKNWFNRCFWLRSVRWNIPWCLFSALHIIALTFSISKKCAKFWWTFLLYIRVRELSPFAFNRALSCFLFWQKICKKERNILHRKPEMF